MRGHLAAGRFKPTTGPTIIGRNVYARENGLAGVNKKTDYSYVVDSGRARFLGSACARKRPEYKYDTIPGKREPANAGREHNMYRNQRRYCVRNEIPASGRAHSRVDNERGARARVK